MAPWPRDTSPTTWLSKTAKAAQGRSDPPTAPPPIITNFSKPRAPRVSSPASSQLAAIKEDPNTSSGPYVPPRNPMRNSAPPIPSTPPRAGTPVRWSGPRVSRFSEDTDIEQTDRNAPPSYEWVPNPKEEDILNPANDAKLAALRRGQPRDQSRRGGWGRFAIIAAAVLLVIVALGIGLGVGLHHGGGKSGTASSSPLPSASPVLVQDFPLGSFAIPANLTSVKTDCTSNPATWSCYPYDVDAGITLEWTITNSSSTYVSDNTTLTTSSSGVPANLTITSAGNPFAVTFSDQAMTYIAPANNASAARLVFGFQTPKSVVPGSPLGSGGQQDTCFFNSTTYMGTLYLSNAMRVNAANGKNVWPYAIEVTQSAAGGANVPNCYGTASGTPVPVAAKPSSDTCVCEYKNF